MGGVEFVTEECLFGPGLTFSISFLAHRFVQVPGMPVTLL